MARKTRATGHHLSLDRREGWAPATGGNMSVRQDDTRCWLSESGRDKGSLTTEDFLQVEIATNRAPSGRKPSAETGLHTPVYRLFPEANVVLHVHTVNATVLSRIEKRHAGAAGI